MSTRTIYLTMLAALTLGCVMATSAAADPYLGHGGGGYGRYHSLYTREYIPYFAQHPPVYYSYPVPRPYGWSPYAYPPGVMTPPAKIQQTIQPAVIQNPFVEPAGETDDTKGKMARTQPLVIQNPYYVAGGRTETATREIATISTRVVDSRTRE